MAQPVRPVQQKAPDCDRPMSPPDQIGPLPAHRRASDHYQPISLLNQPAPPSIQWTAQDHDRIMSSPPRPTPPRPPKHQSIEDYYQAASRLEQPASFPTARDKDQMAFSSNKAAPHSIQWTAQDYSRTMSSPPQPTPPRRQTIQDDYQAAS